MLSYSVEQLERETKPFCSESQYAAKVANYRAVEQSFVSRSEFCAGLPVELHLESTANCNLPCPMCPRGRNLIERTGHLSLERFSRVFSVLSESLASLMISGWGEPLLNPDTSRMVRLATDHGVPVILNTNGTVLDEHIDEILDSGLAVLNIALDGAMSTRAHIYPPELPFDRVVRAVEMLRKAKDHGRYKYPAIHAKFFITDESADEIDGLNNWAFSLGVEHVKFKRKFQAMPSQRDRSKIYSIPKLLQINQHDQVNSTEDIQFHPLSCSHPWDSIFLGGDGQLGLCSWDPFQVVKFGEFTGDYQAIWNGENIRRIRRWHTGQGEVGNPCAQCNRLPGYLRVQTPSTGLSVGLELRGSPR